MSGVDAGRAMHNAGLLAVQRGVYVAGGLIFAALVPRLMGPEVFGQYALIASLATWFVLASTLGFTQVLARYVPASQGDDSAIAKLFGSLLGVRLVSGAGAAGAYLLLTGLAFTGLDLLALAVIAGSVFVRATSQLFFALSLGLDRADRWGMGETVRRWASLAAVLVGFAVGGLRGACAGVLLSELAVLCVGVGWSRPYASWRALHVDVRYLAPYLRFGLLFFVSNLLVSALDHSGEALVRAASGDYSQVGFFGVALNIYLVGVAAIVQLVMAFAPLVGQLLVRDDSAAVRRWAGQLLKWAAVGGVLSAYGALFLGDDLVLLVFGAAYRPVAGYLVPLALALLAVGPASVASLLALTCDRPRVAIAKSSIELVAFWVLGVPLTARLGGLGACLAVLAASAGAAAYGTGRMRSVVHYPLRGWALAGGFGLPFLSLVALRGSWLTDVALYAMFLAGYAAVLFGSRVVTVRECGSAWQALWHRPTATPAVPNT